MTVTRRTSRDAACTMVIGRDTANMGPTCVRASGVTCSQAVISWLPANSNHQHVVCVNNVEVSLPQQLNSGRHLSNYTFIIKIFLGTNCETRCISPYYHRPFTEHSISCDRQSKTSASWTSIRVTHRRSSRSLHRLQNFAQGLTRPTK